MEVKELKNKIKVVFPSESEIFMAEEFLSTLSAVPIDSKDIEADMSEVNSIDTVFLQIAVAMSKTAAQNGHNMTVKSSEAFDKALFAYGMTLEELSGRNK